MLLYGYGSYGNSTDPSFSISRLSLFGREVLHSPLHMFEAAKKSVDNGTKIGKMFKKINTFNDFIDCADWLVANKFTSPKHLYTSGGSAGGLLMGAIVDLRPDLEIRMIAAGCRL